MQKRIIFISLFILIVAGVSGFVWYEKKNPLADKNVIFRVEEGDSLARVSQNLVSEGVIKYRLPFYIAHFVYGRGGSQSGAYELSSKMNARDIVEKLNATPYAIYVTLDPGMTKKEIGERIGKSLNWGLLDREYFSHTYAGMQWQHYQENVQNIFPSTYKWNTIKTQTFLSLSALYNDEDRDFFKNMYVPGTYEVRLNSTRAQVAGFLIDQFAAQYPDPNDALSEFMDKTAMETVAKLIDKEMVLMPDIVAMPPLDVTLKKEGSISNLLFTTSYWNKGRGPLELVADPKTKGLKTDITRNVFQRIYSLDGDYTERLSGRFLWHQPHLHYHFEDFAVYTFEPVEVEGPAMKEKLQFKSTFCVRDSEPIDLSHPGANRDASYKVCGKERQGISPGWADSYYYTYVDQKFNVSNLPAGKYSLKILINPKDRFDEVTKDNNVGEVIVYLDVKNNVVKVLEEKQYGL
ncbi:MAG: endolytic transglycosylase MltG [Candidatus Pacebacteria bacterium]|nr:endolytic transglycosylase MltG [Candidatus Paceibacterota bacterium]